MLVGVVDVGSNTARLLVAEVRDGMASSVHESRRRIGLGDEIERNGVISTSKIRDVAKAVADSVATSRSLGVHEITVLVTSPGRQSANGQELAQAIMSATDVRARLLTAGEEGCLAFAGALASSRVAAPTVAVCDVGGGSAQIAVGSPQGAPTWIRSIDVGSLRLTRRHVHSDPPRRRELAAARADLDALFAVIEPPRVAAALAAGGTARGLQRLVGATLGPAELEEALEIVSRGKARDVERVYGVPRWRARLLPAGAMILAAIQRRLGIELTVAEGGLREGAALELAEHLRVAA